MATDAMAAGIGERPEHDPQAGFDAAAAALTGATSAPAPGAVEEAASSQALAAEPSVVASAGAGASEPGAPDGAAPAGPPGDAGAAAAPVVPPPPAPAAPEDLYAVLGLEPRATAEQVERAYRFSLELYDDGALATYSLLEPAEAERQRMRVREAYEVLGREDQRQAYDAAQGFLPPERSVLPFPQPLPARAPAELPAVLTGAELRRIREARGVSLRHIASVTKIGLRFLEYLEEDRFAFLPAPVYLRGFLQEYARLVGIDPRRAADAYMSRLDQKR